MPVADASPAANNGIGFGCHDPDASKPGRDSLASGPQAAVTSRLLAEMYCILGRPEEAVPLMELSTGDGSASDPDYMAKFSGYMQLGDTYSRLGQLEKSISCYESGLKVQIEALSSSHPMVAYICRYVAEAHLQAMQIDEAEILCWKALKIYREEVSSGSLEEAVYRCLLALICEAMGDFESALEHLVLARMAMAAKAPYSDIASVDVGMGNIHSLLGRDESVLSYHKALKVLKSAREQDHHSVAPIFIRIADVCSKTCKIRESRFHCENALSVYAESAVSQIMSEEIARGLIEISTIYESSGDIEEALKLLHTAMKLLEGSPGHFNTVSGIEVQMGVIFNMIGQYADAHSSFESAILKLQVCGESKSAFFGIALNQMGLACLQMHRIDEAVDFLEEAALVLEHECGSCHFETVGL